MNDLRVLIFSASFGLGHIKASEALIEAIYSQNPNATISHIDAGKLINKSLNRFYTHLYYVLIKYTPKLWGVIYNRTFKVFSSEFFNYFFTKIGVHEVLRCINDFSPELIISTFPNISAILGQLRKHDQLNIPVATVVTDYVVHNQWINSGIDLYLVGCEPVRCTLLEHDIDSHKVKITGIPVSHKFEQDISRKETAKRLGLDPNKLTCLIMAGAYGVLGGINTICESLSQSFTNIQIIAVCGRDDKLYQSLDKVIYDSPNSVIRYKFVDNVEELMTVSDMIITKAGGLTVSEALAKKLPLVIYQPIPGQEEGNAYFLKDIGAAKIARTSEELEKVLHHLFTCPEDLLQMKKAIGKARTGPSAQNAANYILNLSKVI